MTGFALKSSLFAAETYSKQQNRLNFVILITDDQLWDALSCVSGYHLRNHDNKWVLEAVLDSFPAVWGWTDSYAKDDG